MEHTNELLDQNSNYTIVKKSSLKLLNTILLLISVSILTFTAWKIWDTINWLSSISFSQSSAYYINGALINFAVIQGLGIIPAFLIRLKRHYAISSYILIAFIILGFILEKKIELYKYFY
ncbi:MAG: hypothetical protein COA38_12380 [Fluviicola sp.]|nr:MAG: hypothetical protein COA38_12380 [Fluviicola sp.]